MTFPTTSKAASLGVAAMLALCSCASNPVNYYTLVPPASATTTINTSAPARFSIHVLPVGIPAQLDQQQMVVRSGDGSVAILDGERWVAPLGDELRAALSSALVQRLNTQDIAGLPRVADQNVLSIRVQVRRFDAWPGRSVQLEADWTISAQYGERNTRIACYSRLDEAASGDYADMVRAQQHIVGELAGQIAIAAGSLGRPGLSTCSSRS